ncbi:MAG: UTP--glucose-1-phosphate uridylyltransferase [Planctomycetes bacterium]|nr:UTP--glucose-1-phosphate uridylyltransferase [Planctomycetota bacterium]
MHGLTAEQLEFLTRYGFDADLFARWRTDVAEGRLSKAANAVTGELLAPPQKAITKLPGGATKATKDLVKAGTTAIAEGQLGVVVLNGGMATRFGGVVKGVVPVLGRRRSFLALCAEDVLRAQARHGGRIHIYLMNSFATDEATKAHFQEHDQFGLDDDQVHHFTQFVSLRMQPDGSVFRLENGAISPYGPGHGDFADAFRQSGMLAHFQAAGGKHLLVRNVDNLGARIDPVILGNHLKHGTEITCEVAPKWPEDVGGSPYLYEDRIQLIEQIRYPTGFDPSIVDVFNTNTFTFAAAALIEPRPLGWYFVEKQVEGRKAVQIEHLIGEMTRFLQSRFLQVRRSGRDTRFLPVKTPEDLEAARDEIREMYDSDGG